MFYHRGILLFLPSPLNKMGIFQLKLMGIIALKFASRAGEIRAFKLCGQLCRAVYCAGDSGA